MTPGLNNSRSNESGIPGRETPDQRAVFIYRRSHLGMFEIPSHPRTINLPPATSEQTLVRGGCSEGSRIQGRGSL